MVQLNIHDGLSERRVAFILDFFGFSLGNGGGGGFLGLFEISPGVFELKKRKARNQKGKPKEYEVKRNRKRLWGEDDDCFLWLFARIGVYFLMKNFFVVAFDVCMLPLPFSALKQVISGDSRNIHEELEQCPMQSNC